MTTEPKTMDLISFEEFLRVDLRVGEILGVEPIVKSKKLLLLKVSLGENQPERTIVAGLAKHFSVEELMGRRIVIVANLTPANLGGQISEGMLLAASSDDDTIVSLVDPSKEVPLGSRVG